MPVIFIKFGATTFHVPADWNSADNSVICIGHGGWGGQATDADSITASAPVTISSATKAQDATLTGWTTAISAGDVLGFNVDSASTVTKATLTIKVTCT